jgi:hypothetical protein
MANVVLVEDVLYLTVQKFESAIALQRVRRAFHEYLLESCGHGETAFVTSTANEYLENTSMQASM